MFKPEISALKERIKINFKNKNMTKQDPHQLIQLQSS
jgi:hypothetical protein